MIIIKNNTYEQLKELLSSYMEEDYIYYIDKYYECSLEIYKDMKRISGEDYIMHPISVAYILADLKMDPITIGCALIHEALALNKLTEEQIETKFGSEALSILKSVNKISNLKQTFRVNNPEKYRRIIVGLCENASALFIKLCDRLHNLRTLYVHDKSHQKYIIDETQNIYIPIAHRLGLKKLKSEMEDLCLQNSVKDEYQKILKKINSSKQELEDSLDIMKNEISNILNIHNIKFEILSRVKSVRGIYNKLAKGKKWENIYDLLGIRVLVNSVEDCYRVIGLVQSKYNPIPNRFKDFIANPKSNMYQSLHTTVFGENNRIYEIQVRTYEMDEIAEKGFASHWSYKEKTDGSVKNTLDTTLEQLRALIDLNDIDSNMAFFGNLKEELKKNEIYVLTPKGDIIELPNEATPIDFAYKIHSEVGNTTTGALVNNKMVKLNYPLNDGDMVELITQKGHSPSKGWLKIVKTDNAKSRIKSYFYKKERLKYISLGKEMLSSECKKKNIEINDLLNDENIEKLKNALSLDSLDDIYFSISTLRYLPSTILNKLEVKQDNKKSLTKFKNTNNKSNVIIAGSDDILSSLATCCNPIYGEEIVGFITKGYGVKIHSKNCPNIDPKSDRLIDAQWKDNTENRYIANIKIYIDDLSDILLKVLNLTTKYEIVMESFNLVNRNKELFYNLSCKVKNIELLNSFIEELRLIKSVKKVERIFI